MRIETIKNKFYSDRKAMEVTSPNLLVNGVEDPDGLLSPIIFGVTPAEKMEKIGYISLDEPFIHPLVYIRIFQRSFRDITNVINGSKKYRISNGDFVVDPEGNTGLPWLRSIIEETNIYKGIKNDINQGSLITQRLRAFMKNAEREDIFMSRCAVVPLGMRDVSTTGDSIAIDEVNQLYKDLLLKIRYFKENKSLALVDSNVNRYGIQLQLCKIFEYFQERIFKKMGLQRKGMMSRHVDYGSRLVISAPDFSGNRFNDSWIDMDTVGVPLSSVAANCVLFAIYHSRSVLQAIYDDGGMVKKNGENPSQEEIQEYYSGDVITDLIHKYTESWSERGEYMRIPGTENEYMRLKFIDYNGSERFKYITLTEFVYLLVYEPVELRGRYTMLTRYPCQGSSSVANVKVHILSTNKTKDITWRGEHMIFYPDTDIIERNLKTLKDKTIDTKTRLEDASQISAEYRETMVMSNILLLAFGADYDGDKMASRILMSNEANKESEKFNNSLVSMFYADGTNFRMVDDKESINGLYSVTYDDPEDKTIAPKELVDKWLNTKPEDIKWTDILELFSDTPTKKAPYNITTKAKIPTWHNKTLGITSTLGRLIFNIFCMGFLDSEYWDKPITRKGYRDLLEKESSICLDSDENYFKLFKRFIEKLEELGFTAAEYFAPSLDMKTYATSKEFDDFRRKIIEDNREEIEVNNNLIVYEEVEKKLTEKIKEEHKKMGVNTMIYDIGCGKISYKDDIRVGLLSYGTMPIGLGSNNYRISLSNLVDGYRKEELPTYAKSMIVAGYFRALAPASGGATAKEIGAASTNIVLDKKGSNCNSKDYIKITVTDYVSSQIVGRTMIKNGKEVLITRSMVDGLKGTEISLRSTMRCKHDKYCSVCAGETPYKVYRGYNEVPIGLPMTKIGDEMVQAALKKFHDAKTTYVWVNPLDYMVDASGIQFKDIQIEESIIDDISNNEFVNVYILQYQDEIMMRLYDENYGLPMSKEDEEIPPEGSFRYVLHSSKNIIKKFGNKILRLNIIKSELSKRINLPNCEWFKSLPENLTSNTKEILNFKAFDKTEYGDTFVYEAIKDFVDDLDEDVDICESYQTNDTIAVLEDIDIDFLLSESFDELYDEIIEADMDIEYDGSNMILVCEAADKKKPNKALIKFNAAKDKIVAVRDALIKDILKQASEYKNAQKAAARGTFEPAVTAEVKSLNAKYGAIRKAERDKLMQKVNSMMEKINMKIDIKYKKEFAKAKVKIFKGLAKMYAKIDNKTNAKTEIKIEKIKNKFAAKIEALKSKIMGD